MSRKWILIVDDDPNVQGLFKAALERQGYATAGCGDGHEAFEFVRTIVPDLVLLNLRMELDLSKRPEPDLTGAIHHGIGALECVARQACGDADLTLGGIVKQHPRLFPGTLVIAVEKAWGYASEEGRHIREGGKPDRTHVELVVSLAAAVATYLAAKLRAGAD